MTSALTPSTYQLDGRPMSSAAEQIAAKARRLAPYFTSGVVALQGPQGSGKSALVAALVALKRAEGVRCAAASLDGGSSPSAPTLLPSLLPSSTGPF